MRKCTKCKKTKSVTEFNKSSKREDGLQVRCIECNKAGLKAHYQANKEKYLDRNRRRKKIARQYLFDVLKQSRCTDCGENDPVCLEFDHRGDKFKNLANMKGCSIKKIQKEIEKCDIRCSNCHKKKTAKEFGWYVGLK